MIALSAKDIFKESFDQFRKRPLFLIGLMLMLYVPSIINLAAEAISKDRTLLTIVLAIVFYLVGIFLNVFLPVALLKQEHIKNCNDDDCKKACQDCIDACQKCIKSCEECCKECKTNEDECEDACTKCKEACENCIRACNKCIENSCC
jgi:predicted membrane protein